MSETPTATSSVTDIVNAFLSDVEITFGAGHGGYTFDCDGADYELVIDESFHRDGNPALNEIRATIWTADGDADSEQVATVRFLVDVIA